MGPDKYIKNYIDGTLAPAGTGDYLEDINPATASVYAQFPKSGESDVQFAVEAAERAYPAWSSLDVEKRFRLLMRLADILEQEINIFARAESSDTGKPLSMALSADLPQSHATLRYYATAMLHLSNKAYHSKSRSVHYSLRSPVGLVACMPHWNYPLLSLMQKVAPALAAGNCVLVHPSVQTPMTAYLFSKACIEAGIPPGVVSIIYGDKPITDAMLTHPKVNAIVFSGSNARGEEVAAQTVASFKKLSLDLGGKNPNIIFADCNFDQMIIGTLRSAFSNNGQSAFSQSRIYVERLIYEKTRDELVKRSQFFKVGDPSSKVTDLGALISAEHRDQVLSYIALSEVEGGKLLCGGKPVELSGPYEKGFFLRPAIIEGLSPVARMNQEEIFGPLVTIAPFDTEQEAVNFANTTAFGRSASIWTQNTSRANRMAEQIRAGLIWINAWMLPEPRQHFHAMGAAGNSRLGGMESLYFMLDEKVVGSRI